MCPIKCMRFYTATIVPNSRAVQNRRQATCSQPRALRRTDMCRFTSKSSPGSDLSSPASAAHFADNTFKNKSMYPIRSLHGTDRYMLFSLLRRFAGRADVSQCPSSRGAKRCSDPQRKTREALIQSGCARGREIFSADCTKNLPAC